MINTQFSPSESQAYYRIRELLQQPGRLQIRTSQPILTPHGPDFIYHWATTILQVSPPEIIVGSGEGDWIKGEPSAVLHSLLQRASQPTPLPPETKIFHARTSTIKA